MPDVQLHALSLFKIKPQHSFLSAIINIMVKNIKPLEEADVVDFTFIHCSMFQSVIFTFECTKKYTVCTQKDHYCVYAVE